MATEQVLSVVMLPAAKSVRTYRNVRAASCSVVVRRKNPRCCRPEVHGTGVDTLKIQARSRRNALISLHDTPANFEECQNRYDFPQFLFNN